jgi:hypothetical protein
MFMACLSNGLRVDGIVLAVCADEPVDATLFMRAIPDGTYGTQKRPSSKRSGNL